jgi:hypothetical protein
MSKLKWISPFISTSMMLVVLLRLKLVHDIELIKEQDARDFAKKFKTL